MRPTAPSQPPSSDQPSGGYACPHCGQLLAVTCGPEAQMLTCPACGGAFVLAAADGTTDLPESQPDQAASAASREDELDGRKIGQLARARRATIRARSYLLVVTLACAVAGIQALWNLLSHLRAGDWGRKPLAYVSIILVLGWIAAYCAGRAVGLHRELRTSALQEPPTSPNFSALGDGSQHWRNLEEMAAGRPQPQPPETGPGPQRPPEP